MNQQRPPRPTSPLDPEVEQLQPLARRTREFADRSRPSAFPRSTSPPSFRSSRRAHAQSSRAQSSRMVSLAT